MKYGTFVLRFGILLFLVFAMAFAFISCEPTVTIHAQNQTNEILNITIDGVSMGKVNPGGEVKKLEAGIFSRYSIVAEDMQGKVIYEKIYTREEMVQNKWRVVIQATPKSIVPPQEWAVIISMARALRTK